MNTRDYKNLLDQIEVIQSQCVILEGIARRANTEQPLVGPPEKSNGRPAALARPATLSELKTFIEEMRSHYSTDRCGTRFEAGVVAACERILHQMGTLDQGSIASELTGECLLRMVSKVGESEGIDI
jgi:hypothetical protein